MASKCIGDCANSKSDVVCVRPGTTYAKIHKWPEAEAEFVRSISNGGKQLRTTAVDSISCRQMYLRSYTFSRREENKDGDRGGGDAGDPRNDRKCFGEGGRKAAKKGKITSKTMSHREFVVRCLMKCLSCISPTKVNVDKKYFHQ